MSDLELNTRVATPSALACLAQAAVREDGAGAALLRDGGASGWPVPVRGAHRREIQVAPATSATRSLRWVEDAFGCAEWSAPEGESGKPRRIVCDGALGQVGHCDIGSLRIRRGARPEGDAAGASIYLWFIERGALQVRLDDGQDLNYGAGDLLLSDGAQPLRALWLQASVHHLRLPRHRVEAVVGADAAATLQGVMALNRFGMASFLGAQLHLLQRQGPGLVAAELGEALSVVFGTVDSLLRLALPGRSEARAPVAIDRVQAVYRFIDKNLHRHDLNAEQIAAGVNSSRAQVYRLFQGQPLTVHGALREARLRKSMEYLQHGEDRHLTIGAIAYACGFSDQSVFSKLFRQRFGLTPSEVRNAHTRGHARDDAASAPRIGPIALR